MRDVLTECGLLHNFLAYAYCLRENFDVVRVCQVVRINERIAVRVGIAKTDCSSRAWTGLVHVDSAAISTRSGFGTFFYTCSR
ncbi:hypothetical protein D3C84_1120360 [compost metagenome]